MPKIFISYGRDESHGQSLATEAQQQLQAAGFEVFLDVIGLKPGDRWDTKLEFELETSDLVVLVISEKIRTSDWVYNEISMAREIGLPIIPVIAEHVRMPLWIRHLQVLDFSIQVNWEQLFDAIFSKLDINPVLKAVKPPSDTFSTSPKWASKSGEDQFGKYADIQIQHIKQRFRYIEAGAFLMGSPDSEVGRFSDEDQHLVTLTQGFWLGESAVTQELWEAVTGSLPACFTGDKNLPVYKVGWNETQEFINTLNFQFKRLRARLPTEAQWEYACRAGTTSPFSFGQQVTPNQVNYMDDSQGEGVFRVKPLPVKSLPANSWGLYEMHGNVSEWCQDAWLERLGRKAAVDPEVRQGDGYVFRGGSWYYDSRGIRSAARNNGSGAAVMMVSVLGFRWKVKCLAHTPN
ncbi:SUMF1/EgtB/PvdO family nonheme iron enzyme [Leucothrix mucor]|uniref:SUMF1/EgtB/PvdO family nonheme iron enzyme n=1 Tax=Leucothrix mucor TaxID=45248 RepID=UPI0003B4F5B8|nr:SUMF1/EgtB/PvdO family nonheme iron enzyme [Leucothrix mucor]